MAHLNSVAVITALSAVFAIAALLAGMSASMAGKRTDVLIDSHKRFDALMVARVELLRSLRGDRECADLSIELDAWSERFWSLQFDQFVWWRKGFVAADVFGYWLKSRQHEFRRHGVTPESERWWRAVYFDGWERVSRTWQQEDKWNFVICIELVRRGLIQQAIALSAPGWWVRLGIT